MVSPKPIVDVQMTSSDLARRWGMNDGSIRMMRVEGRGPAYVTLGKTGGRRRPRVRYWLSAVLAYEQEHGRPSNERQTHRPAQKRRHVSV